MENTDQQHPSFKSHLDYHLKMPSDAAVDNILNAQAEGVSVFARHKHFDPNDTQNITGM